MRPVYFYSVPSGTPDRAEYQYLAICIAQGLRELGVDVVGDVAYWRSAPGAAPLIRHDPEIQPHDCAAVVVSHVWPESGRPLPDAVTARDRTYRTAYLDQADGAISRAWDPAFRAFDVVLRTHGNTRQRGVPSNVRPWAFGLSQRVIESTAGAPDPSDRARALLVNFRVRHLLRRRAWTVMERDIAPLLPLDTRTDSFEPTASDALAAHRWRLTGRRHNPAYYARLTSTLACAVFGGFLGPRSVSSVRRVYDAQRLAAHAFEPVRRRAGRPPAAVYQWDSWRLWETLSAGTAAFHVDLGAYGAALPVMPQPGVHYVGMDLDRPGPTVERLRDEPEWVADVAQAGRQWALEHYSPRATALRFLRVLDLPPPSGAASPSQ